VAVVFYTYLYFRQKDATPYYVGKGVNSRAFSPQHNVPVPKDKSRILIQYWESEDKSLDMEEWWIALYGRKDLGTGILRNLTDGGDNPPSKKGFKHSEEARRKVSEALERQYASGERSRDGGMLGKHHSEESRNRIGISNTGKKHSEESKKKMSLAKLGKKVVNYPKSRKVISEESRAKLRMSQQARRERENTWLHFIEQMDG
jgi:NUMOD3 motif